MLMATHTHSMHCDQLMTWCHCSLVSFAFTNVL